MVMVTAKLSKQKLLLIAALLVDVVVVLCLCLHGSGNSSETPDTAQEPVAVDVKTNEGRVAFLASFGWEVAEEPVQTQEVRVPTEPNEVFQRYNELQISQGYDLTQYSGKTLRRYVYTVTNYPAADGGPYYATVLVYKNEVAGGDVCSAAQNGVMHSFTMPYISNVGIGHQMSATLDGKTQYTDLSQYFTPAAGNTGGTIAYPLESLIPGEHSIRFRVWDSLNNSSDTTLYFNVV